MRRVAGWVLAATAVLSACGPSSKDVYSGELPERVDFNFHVKPILSDRCFTCHGPDDAARKAELRLDTPEGLQRVTDGALFRPAEMVRRILSHDPDEVMPPKDSNLSLSPYEMAILARWVEQGAQYKPHWAFLPPEKQAPPAVDDPSWPENPIDNFILARLEREGLTPSAEADPERLIRRVTFDLTGLPPTVEELNRFREDTSPDAYEKLVDRLLASPTYGERMAARWLDLARYSDSNGYQDDGIRYMWHWRDWVIDSFNENQSYDEFVTWQLAGDLLPNATREQILATGFNRNHAQNGEGGLVDEEYRVEYVADRTNTFGKAFLGVTMECARCHDHKYDPISQKDYYSIFAFFNNNNEIGTSDIDGNTGPTLILLSEEEKRELAEIRKQKEAREQAVQEYVARIEDLARRGEYLEPLRAPRPDLHRGLIAHFPLDDLTDSLAVNLADPAQPAEVGGALEVVPGKLGGAVEIRGGGELEVEEAYMFDRQDPFSLSVWVQPTEEIPYSPIVNKEESGNRAHRGWELSLQDGLVSATLAHDWPTAAIAVTSKASVPLDTWTHLVMTYDGSSKASGLRIYINGKPAEVTVDIDRLQRTIVQDRLPFYIGQKGGSTDPASFEGGRIDDVRIYDRMLTAPEAAALAGLSPFEELREVDPSEWTDQQRQNLLAYQLHTGDREYAEQLDLLREIRAKETELLSEANDVMVMEELPEPRPTFVLNRGAYDAPTDPVEPSTPASVLEFPDSLPPNRLGLARWLFSSENPLTARVVVNRYWQMFFGTGLVKTSDDFGNQGSLPTHPELLDWLAVTYQESGWDTKAFLKTLVMSATYRQSSHTSPELRERDPENVLLARGPSYRLPAEMIRDGALLASGLLVPTIGGPSVKIYQPEGLWEEKSAGRGALAEYVQDHGDDLYRRSIYTFWKLSSPHPVMTIFDAAERNFCTVRRQRTNTPLQALVLMNDPQFVEAARMLAERMVKEGGETVSDKIRFGFRAVTSRSPSATELSVLEAFHGRQLERFEGDRDGALELLSTGEHERDRSLDAAEVAAYALVANTLLNLDEAVTKR